MIKTFLHIILFLFPISGLTQINFYNSYGGSGNDYGESILMSIDSGFTVIGATESFGAGNTDMYLFKIDSAGNLLWSKAYGGVNIDWGMDLQQTSDSGYALVGYSNSSNFDYNVYFVKTDKNGDSIWTKNFGGSDWDFGYAVDIQNDTTYIIAGETYSYSNGDSDGYSLGINSSGDTIWSQHFGSTAKDAFNAVCATSTNEIVFGGYTTSSNGDTDFWVVKTDSVGNEIWQYNAGDSLDDAVDKIIEGNDGNYYCIGSFTSIVGKQRDIVVHQLDPNGNFMNQFLLNNDQDDVGKFILQYAGETNFFIGGKTNSYGNGGYDTYFYEVDASGWIVGQPYSTNGTHFDDNTEAADTTYDHGLVLVGTTNATVNGINSVFVLKIDSSFNSPSVMTELLDISSVEEEKQQITSFIYPNPGKSVVYFGNTELNNNTVNIFDLTGKLVMKNTVRENSINIQNLPSGMYYLKFPGTEFRPVSFVKE